MNDESWAPALPVLEQREQGRQTEVLDFPKYGALYGRFLLASLPGADIANTIDPDKKVEFKDMMLDALRERDYNPVFQNLSIEERQEQWKDFKPSTEYSTAYSQWRTEFTGFMTKITDSNRESALMIIMLNPKNAVQFTENDADELFEEFCGGKSDITNFIKRVKTNLISDGRINPTNFQELLRDLEWIASGLFGKNTASQAVTRLIELESALHNDPGKVLDTFNLNRERINKLEQSERMSLGFLHDTLRLQVKLSPTQAESEEVISATVPKPAPVPESDEDEQLQIKPPPTASQK